VAGAELMMIPGLTDEERRGLVRVRGTVASLLGR